MSSLWEQCKTTMKQKHMRPSPKIRNILNPCKKILPAKLSLVIEYIKRISLPMLQRTCVRGSMTVEAALVLPLFCFFVISMGNAIEIIRLHGNLEVALWNAGRQICVYGALPEGQQGYADHRLEAVAVSYTYVKEQIEEQLGEEYLEMSPLDGGSDGLQFLESDIEGDIYTINMTYRIAGISQLSGFKNFEWPIVIMVICGTGMKFRRRKTKSIYMLRKTVEYIIRTENVRTFGYPSVWWKRQRLCGSTDHVKNAQTKYRIRQEDCYFSFRKTENVITAGGIVQD